MKASPPPSFYSLYFPARPLFGLPVVLTNQSKEGVRIRKAKGAAVEGSVESRDGEGEKERMMQVFPLIPVKRFHCKLNDRYIAFTPRHSRAIPRMRSECRCTNGARVIIIKLHAIDMLPDLNTYTAL